jgi:hypothetical protein
MRAPPPVEYPSALGRAWRSALSLLVAASVAAPLAWGLPYFAAHWGSLQPEPLFDLLGQPAVQAWLALWAAVVAAVAFWLASTDRRVRTLRWDGQEWVLASPGRPDQRGDAALMLDLGPWMLVRFLPYATGGAVAGSWLPLSLAGDLVRWSALRGALWNGQAAERRP